MNSIVVLQSVYRGFASSWPHALFFYFLFFFLFSFFFFKYFFGHYYYSANSILLSLFRFSYFVTPYDAQASSAFRALVYFYRLKNIKLDGLCESSTLQRIHMKNPVFFSLKNKEGIFMNVVCCSCDWRFNGYGE